MTFVNDLRDALNGEWDWLVGEPNPDNDDEPFDWEDAAEYVDEFHYEGGMLPGLGTFKHIASWNLGDGNETGYVTRHEESGRLYRKTGTYSSWDATYWEEGDFDEVEPREVTVTRYVSKDTGKVFNDPVVDA